MTTSDKKLCTECMEHSGHSTQLKFHSAILHGLDEKINTIEDRTHKILVGIILCGLAAILSASVSIYTVSHEAPKQGNRGSYYITCDPSLDMEVTRREN